MRTHIAALALALLSIAGPAPAQPEPLDIGSCYSVRPICFAPQVPLCICDVTRNCFWACK